MKKLLLVAMVLLWLICVGAEEVAVRPAFDLVSTKHHARSADNCEIIFWTDTPSGNRDIFAQKLNPSGVPQWSEAIRVVSHSGDQNLLAVVPSSDNNFIILWEEYEIFDSHQIRMQKLSSNGQSLWPANGIQISSGDLRLKSTALIPNNTGGAIVIYENYLQPYIVFGQNLDSWGNQLWPAGGHQLSSDTSYSYVKDTVSDGEGGVIINIFKTQPVQYSHLLRISAQGTIVGNNPLLPANVFPSSVFQIKTGSNGQYILYQRLADPGTEISFTKMDNLGNLLLPQPVCYSISSYTGTEMAPTAEGGMILAWHQYASENTYSFRMQKFDANFLPLWQTEGIEVASNFNRGRNISLAVHENGNIWTSWDESIDASEMNFCRAQMLSPAGVPAWPEGGKLLSTGNGYPLSLAFADRGMFFFSSRSEGMESIRCQVIGTGGDYFLSPQGLPLVQQLNGVAYLAECIAINDRFVSVWRDDRYYSQIYYQISNPNLQPLLQENGKALNPDETNYEFLISAQKTPENNLAILYGLEEEDLYRFYVQQVNSSGQSLYPGLGIEILSYPGYRDDLKMGFVGADIYLGWKERDADNLPQIKGQRISYGQKMWGENGIAIASPAFYSAYLESVRGAYYVWKEKDWNAVHEQCRILHVDVTGEAMPGWDSAGLTLIDTAPVSNIDVMQTGLVDDDLVLIVRLTTNAGLPSLAQRISADGQRMWTETGVNLGEGWALDAIFGTDTAVLLISNLNYEEQLSYNRISETGVLLFAAPGTIISSQLNNCYEAKLVKLDDGTSLCVFTDNDGNLIQNRDIFMRQLNPSGLPMGDETQLFCGARYQQHQVFGAGIGNQAMIAWSDDRAGIYDNETAFTGVWAKNFSSNFVDNDDPFTVPQPRTILHANYPNPFNPSTTISFSLPYSGKVELAVYNLKGQLVNSLLPNVEFSAGKHDVIWTGLDSYGKAVSSGVYFCRLTVAGTNLTRKIVLAK